MTQIKEARFLRGGACLRSPAATARDIANRLAKLSRLLEKREANAEVVADFLMRLLFTMFAEDIELIPKKSFEQALKRIRHQPELFAPLVEGLWKTMKTGGVAGLISAKIPRFNVSVHALNPARAASAA